MTEPIVSGIRGLIEETKNEEIRGGIRGAVPSSRRHVHPHRR